MNRILSNLDGEEKTLKAAPTITAAQTLFKSVVQMCYQKEGGPGGPLAESLTNFTYKEHRPDKVGLLSSVGELSSP